MPSSCEEDQREAAVVTRKEASAQRVPSLLLVEAVAAGFVPALLLRARRATIVG